MFETRYYSIRKEKTRCELCPHFCVLADGQKGICKNRINIGNKLFSLAYGKPCAIHNDPIEKKPLYHFLPASKTFSISSSGCNLGCMNCQNWTLSQTGPDETDNFDKSPMEIVEMAIKEGSQSIAYTYGEPITWIEYMIDIAKIAKSKGIKNVLISAGYINPKPLNDLLSYLDAANIDLKSLDDKLYRELNSATLKPVLNTIKTLFDSSIWLEITHLIIPGLTDSDKSIQLLCRWLADNRMKNVPVHFSKFYPMYKLSWVSPTPAETIQKAIFIAKKEGLRFVYSGNLSSNQNEHTFCPSCQNMLIEREGFKIKRNFISNASCHYCSEKIPGIWK